MIEAELRISQSLQQRLNAFKQAEMNKVVRQSLRVGLTPITKALKKKLRVLRNTSRQSTGATHRAIISKVKYPSKSQRNHGYASVGVDMDYTERHYGNSGFMRMLMKDTQVRRHVGVSNVGRRQRGRYTVKSKYVKSYQTTRLRISRSTGKGKNRRPRNPARNFQKNVPGKYWHILNLGAPAINFFGYRFTTQTQQETKPAAIAAFEASIERLLQLRGG